MNEELGVDIELLERAYWQLCEETGIGPWRSRCFRPRDVAHLARQLSYHTVVARELLESRRRAGMPALNKLSPLRAGGVVELLTDVTHELHESVASWGRQEIVSLKGFHNHRAAGLARELRAALEDLRGLTPPQSGRSPIVAIWHAPGLDEAYFELGDAVALACPLSRLGRAGHSGAELEHFELTDVGARWPASEVEYVLPTQRSAGANCWRVSAFPSVFYRATPRLAQPAG